MRLILKTYKTDTPVWLFEGGKFRHTQLIRFPAEVTRTEYDDVDMTGFPSPFNHDFKALQEIPGRAAATQTMEGVPETKSEEFNLDTSISNSDFSVTLAKQQHQTPESSSSEFPVTPVKRVENLTRTNRLTLATPPTKRRRRGTEGSSFELPSLPQNNEARHLKAAVRMLPSQR
jgi:hypothetical protein